MTAATVQRFGSINGGADKTALFLKMYGGEVLTAFEEMNVFMPLHTVRTINAGKSAQFPATWKLTASDHTPGAEIVGQSSNVNERVISIDGIVIADAFIADIDDAMTHYEVRSIYSTEAGRALSKQIDTRVAQVLVLAARAAATVTGGNGGTQLTNAGYANNGSTIASGLFAATQALDEKDAPDQRYAAFKPAQYYLMAQTTDVINRDWGGAGAFAKGTVLEVAGVQVVKSNHVPSTNVTTGPAAYQGDFTNTKGVVWCPSAAGTVKLMDLSTRMDYDPRRLGHLIVSKYAMGHGILRPECSVEMKSA